MYTIATVFLDGEMSGTPRRIYRIAKYLSSKAFRSVVIIPKADGEFAAMLREIGVTVYELDGLIRPRRTLRPAETAKWVSRLLPNVLQVRRILAAERADVMHAYGMSQVIAPLASIGLTCKVVWHINDDSVPTGLGRPFLKVMQWMSDRVTVSSGALAGKYFGAKDAVGLGLTDILYSTVDLDDFKATRPRDATRAAFGIEPADVVVGMIGNVAPAKGQREFIEAAGLLSKRTGKRVRFLMVGRTLPLRVGYADEVKRLVDRLGLGTQLVQLGYRNDIPDLLAAMDILVVPSLWEPLGVIVMEGMAMSKPIVASNTGGIPEMVCDGRDALLIPPSNPAAMAQAVESLLDSPQFALRLAESAHARMKATFAPEAAAAMYEHLYFRLLNQTGPRVCSDISTPNTNPAND